MNFFLNTVDLDRVDYHFVFRIINKISKCSHLIKLYLIDTKSGYHLRFYCNVDCDLCRFVFDDQKRYFYDQFRPKWSRNVLFEPFQTVFLRLPLNFRPVKAGEINDRHGLKSEPAEVMKGAKCGCE